MNHGHYRFHDNEPHCVNCEHCTAGDGGTILCDLHGNIHVCSDKFEGMDDVCLEYSPDERMEDAK